MGWRQSRRIEGARAIPYSAKRDAIRVLECSQIDLHPPTKITPCTSNLLEISLYPARPASTRRATRGRSRLGHCSRRTTRPRHASSHQPRPRVAQFKAAAMTFRQVVTMESGEKYMTSCSRSSSLWSSKAGGTASPGKSCTACPESPLLTTIDVAATGAPQTERLQSSSEQTQRDSRPCRRLQGGDNRSARVHRRPSRDRAGRDDGAARDAADSSRRAGDRASG